MALLETVNLEQSYDGNFILREIELGIDKSEVLAFIGPTGAGKTTLLRLLDLLEVPSGGKIYFDNVDVTHSHQHRLAARRRMSYVQQKPIVFTMNVYDNIAYGLKLRHEDDRTIHQKVQHALELVGMGEYSQRQAKTLSGGETQRVAIARSLVVEPEVLFLDEPTANLDPITTSKVEEVLSRIISEQKITVVMTTHDMSQGQRIARKIGVIINGKLLQIGSPNEIFCSPSTKEVAEFVGVDNILKGEIVEKEDNLVTIRMNGSVLQAISDYPLGEKVYILIRPEDITFSNTGDTSSARNMLKGTITKLTGVGALMRIEVDCGFHLFGVITTRSAQELDFSIGKEIYLSFKATALHVIKRWK
jgi:tungstate transport system ATP-binding protein